MSSHILCPLGVVSILLLAAAPRPASTADGIREAWLVPPAGASSPAARGQVSIGPDGLVLLAEGLEPGDYPVLLDDGTGTKTAIGVLLVDEDEAGARGGHPGGKLELGTAALPFAATSPLDLAGRSLWVAEENGSVVLAGKTPMPITAEPELRSGRCTILRPNAAPESEAEGELKLESGGGRVVLKVHLKRLAPQSTYRVAFLDPASSGAAESLGLITTDDAGKGQLKLDSGHGDPIPFGAGDLAALVGVAVEVRDAGDRLVLAGTVCEPSVLEVESDDDDGKVVKGCTLDLDLADDAPIAAAEGEAVVEAAEGEGAELEVEIVIDIPGAAFDVSLTDPAPRGESASLGRVVMDCRGEGEVEVRDDGGPALPFGKSSVLELAGYLVSVKDESGALVLHGVVPDLACPDSIGAGEDEEDDDDDDETIIIPGCSAGAVPGNLVDGPPFSMIGEHDAPFHRGDVNEDRGVSISDSVFTLLHLFKGGPRPRCLDAADFNDDGAVDLTDPIDVLRYLFLGDRMARSPGTLIVGFDPTPDGLYCEE